MSFNTYCRECATHFADGYTKNLHVNVVHHGIAPPPPNIPEELFYTINSHIPQVRAKTCPVCLIHFQSLSACVYHVDNHHPIIKYTGSLLRPTKEIVIFEWERLVEAAFPGAFELLRKSFRVKRCEPMIIDDDDNDFDDGSSDYYDR